jgi:Dihaem cytochrome c
VIMLTLRRRISGFILPVCIVGLAVVGPQFTVTDEGEELAKVHCASCHAYPEPALLPVDMWEKVLPDMGHFMGIYETDTTRAGLIERGPCGCFSRKTHHCTGRLGSDLRFLPKSRAPATGTAGRNARIGRVAAFQNPHALPQVVAAEYHYG